jgi:hypothetical protein
VDTLDILTEHLFDYSGTFPPESKSFEDALATAATFHKSLLRPTMVNACFVTTVNNYQQFVPTHIQELGYTQQTFPVALLGASITTSLDPIRAELDTLIAAASANQASAVTTPIISYELKVSDDFLYNIEQCVQFLRMTESFHGLIALEPDLSSDQWQQTMHQSIALMKERPEQFALKIRGTGPTAIDTTKIAFVIDAAVEKGIHLKATGGMHHPIIEDRYGNTLGFLSFAAAYFLKVAYRNKLAPKDLFEILQETRASSFTFSPTTFSWGQYHLAAELLQEAKRTCRLSIGSCSIHEPDADLKRLFPR